MYESNSSLVQKRIFWALRHASISAHAHACGHFNLFCFHNSPKRKLVEAKRYVHSDKHSPNAFVLFLSRLKKCELS